MGKDQAADSVMRGALLGWQASDAVRCDPAYRNRTTGGGVQSGDGGRFVGRGEGGTSIERRRWTTTLRPEALDILRELAECHGISRNEVVEALLLDPPSRMKLAPVTDDAPPEVVVSTRISRPLRDRVESAAAAAEQSPSAWLRSLIASHLP